MGLTFGLYLCDLDRNRNDSQGVINYAVGLAGALPTALAADERLVLYVTPAIADELPPPTGSVFHRFVSTPTGIPPRLWSDHVSSLARARRDGVDVLHFPKGHIPAVRFTRSKVVATVHDDIAHMYARGRLGPARFAGRGQWAKHRYFEWATRNSLQRADHVLTISKFAEGRLRRLVPGGAPMTVTYLGMTLPHVVAHGDPRNYLLHLGSPFPHKRSAQAVRYALRFISERQLPLELLVTGRAVPASDPRVRTLEKSLSNIEIAQLMANARALIFNSVYEGFGLPPVESYWLGTPAIFPNVGAMAEVMAGIDGGFEPGTYSSFAAALDRVLALDEPKLLRLGTILAKRYDWNIVARKTVDAYRSAASGQPGRA